MIADIEARIQSDSCKEAWWTGLVALLEAFMEILKTIFIKDPGYSATISSSLVSSSCM